MAKTDQIGSLVLRALQRRPPPENTNAYRLFNGFYEGLPGIVLDRFGRTLVVMDHTQTCQEGNTIQKIVDIVLAYNPGLNAVLLKQRYHSEEQRRKGILIYGETLADSITEFGINYAVDLRMNQDASFYLDTRLLRHWLLDHMSGLRVLNTFAYTGSLGVAAGAGGALQVKQTDINAKFLDLAQKSWDLNQLPQQPHQLLIGDFYRVAGRLRHSDQLFDCVIVDPPYFSKTDAGRVDLQQETTSLINKIRPLVAHQGWLVVINNALFLPGVDFKSELEALCQSEYVNLETTIPVPSDITGYPETIVSAPPVSPEPFNHPTKIAILKIYRKDGRK